MFMECKTLEISWVLILKHYNRGLREDGRSLKQMSHECLLKADLEIFTGNFAGKLPVKFRWYFVGKIYL